MLNCLSWTNQPAGISSVHSSPRAWAAHPRPPAPRRHRFPSSTPTSTCSTRRVRKALPIQQLPETPRPRSPRVTANWQHLWASCPPSSWKPVRGSKTTSGRSKWPKTDPIITGIIGNLQPEKPEFREYLDRHRKNKLFLGIRYGNLWGYNLVQQLSNPVFIEGLKLLQDAGLTLDTANPRPDLLEAVLRLSDRLPGLRIVVDHLPALLWRLDAQARSSLEATLRDLARRPSVYVKVSTVMRMVDGKASTSPALYKPLLDQVFETFNEDRLVFGSDWPNADAVDNLPAIVQIARDYVRTKGTAAAEKLFGGTRSPHTAGSTAIPPSQSNGPAPPYLSRCSTAKSRFCCTTAC